MAKKGMLLNGPNWRKSKKEKASSFFLQKGPIFVVPTADPMTYGNWPIFWPLILSYQKGDTHKSDPDQARKRGTADSCRRCPRGQIMVVVVVVVVMVVEVERMGESELMVAADLPNAPLCPSPPALLVLLLYPRASIRRSSSGLLLLRLPTPLNLRRRRPKTAPEGPMEWMG